MRKRYETKAEQLERIAREMRERYLSHGRGCKARLKAILKRTKAA